MGKTLDLFESAVRRNDSDGWGEVNVPGAGAGEDNVVCGTNSIAPEGGYDSAILDRVEAIKGAGGQNTGADTNGVPT